MMGVFDRWRKQQEHLPSSLQITTEYIEALATGDSKRMDSLRATEFVLDFVHVDAFAGGSWSAEEAERFWPSWFAAFPEMDYAVRRTVAAKDVVVTQWVFTGTHTGSLGPPILERPVAPTGRTIRVRGVSIYDVGGGLIQRETLYLDFATLLVELGVEW
jgi:steroid delta-isomerase-like uncharacterized protein